ncbi:erythromycin esterase family protein [Crossiella sp. SN42]|uniref:erythromycin esterase family protein n=1 Tax=Crossiella sp. SN42 TaxID=2944808 RepID=UPI00207CF06A|nr:erythromycin esterase family protein [Crossiella sp. SN42]MCO1581619.1 erythromycin esterase family protein [Crossiella sp. SN42]
MSQDIRDFVTTAELVALGEPTHQEPAFGHLRNELFAQLAAHGFRSIALETCRVAALAVNDYVQEGIGTLDSVLAEGFTHNFGELAANRELVAWMREYNEGRPPADRLACHGFDAAMETFSVPSPRRFLEHARDYLGLDLDFAALLGADEQWSDTAAVMDPDQSPGATPEAVRARVLADELLTMLDQCAPGLIATTSRAAWERARVHLTAGLDLLRYHYLAAQQIESNERWGRLSATRDTFMARNILDIRGLEARRGGTLLGAHNLHLQTRQSHMAMGPLTISWLSAGAMVAALTQERYTFVAGSLGRSAKIGLGEPHPDTYEAELQERFATWGLTKAEAIAPAEVRTDMTPQQGYFPLDEFNLGGAAAVLHVSDGAAVGS